MGMLGFRGWVGLFSVVCGVAVAVPTPVTVCTVTPLEAAEPYAPLLFHSSALWTGRNRSDGRVAYNLELYSPDGRRKRAELRLPHTIGTILAQGPNVAIVIGKSYVREWLTHYSTVTFRNGQLTASTHTFSRNYMMDEGATGPAGTFFAEPGSRSVFRHGFWGPSRVGGAVSGPGQMALVGQRLFVLERKGPALGDENLVRIDLRARTTTRTFGADRAGLVSVLGLAGGGHVAVSENIAGQVHLVDVGTNRVAATLAVPSGSPRGLAQLGHCLVVGTDDPEKKVVTFYDLSSPQRSIVDEWDLSGADRHFLGIHAIAVDPASGRVYARSKLPSLEGGESSNHVIVAEQASDETRRRCTR